MRQSLFERLKNRKISYIKELQKITNLIQGFSYAQTFFEKAFKLSPYRIFNEDFNVAMDNIFETNIYLAVDNSYSLHDKINYAIFCNVNITLNSFLDYLEFLKTLISIGPKDYKSENVVQIDLIIDNNCRSLGYCFERDQESMTFRTRLIKPEAEALMTKVKTNVGDKISKYLMLRSGDVNGKRSCLKDLADDIEPICSKYCNIAEYKKIGHFIQCIRHTKEKPLAQFGFFYKDEEKWMDKTFDAIIGILSFTNTKKIVEEIIDSENFQS